MSELTDDATSGYHAHILQSIVERASVLVDARMELLKTGHDFPYSLLAELMVAAETRELGITLGLDVSELVAELERIAEVVERK